MRCPARNSQAECHSWLSDLIYRALIRANTPAVKEPQGLCRNNGKRPDGLRLVPWQSERSATWDVTVPHTLATSYVSQNALQTGSAAAAMSARKTTKYSTLSATHMFFSGCSRDSWSLVIASLQISAEEPRFAQPICEKLRSCANVFQWQFSISMQCALPTCSQFPSPHRNHSGHIFLLLLIFTPLHGMQTQSSDENSVCPSVCLYVCLSVCQMRAL